MKKRYGTWTVFSIALLVLFALMLVPAVTALKRTDRMYQDVHAMQEGYERSQRILERVTREAFLMSVTIREFLLDTSPDNDALYADRLGNSKSNVDDEIAALRGLANAGEDDAIERLQREVAAYWASLLPVLRWSPRERAQRATYFLRQEQRPRRESLLAIAGEIGNLNRGFLRKQYEDLAASQRLFRRELNRTLQLTIVAGLLVVGASIVRMAMLERRTSNQYEHMQRTGNELRELSARLRHAQEEERKAISRELHDEVGQKLTALRMELGGLERIRHVSGSEFSARLADTKLLAEQSMMLIRDMAAALRPSVLDNLGLAAAIQNHARQFSRRTGIPVEVEVRGMVDGLPDRHRIYLYRIVQEGLTNCAKHSGASRVVVTLAGNENRVQLSIRDNGVGIDTAAAAAAGLGLVGIADRVRELGGSFEIEGTKGKGTQLAIAFELRQERERQDSSVAGG